MNGHPLSWPTTFRARAAGEEWIDLPETSLETLRVNLREQAWINRHLGGGHAVWRHALPFLARCPSAPIQVLEMGCGGADLSRYLVDVARRMEKPIHVVGLDRQPAVLSCAREWCRDYPEITLVQADALTPPFARAGFDLVLLPDLLHHLPAASMAPVLQVASRLCRGLVVVTDLLRSPLAYLAFLSLARVASLSLMSRHDGALSIRRGFTPDEFHVLAQEAGLVHWALQRHRLFRLALTYPGTG